MNDNDRNKVSRSLLPKRGKKRPSSFSCKKLQLLVTNRAEGFTVLEKISIELSAYIDKELPAWKRLLIQQHLRRCPNCTAHVLRLEQTERFLHRVERVKAPDDFLAGVMSQAMKAQRRHPRVPSHCFRQATERENFGLTPGITGKKKEKMPQLMEGLRRWVKQHIQTDSLIYTFVLTLTVFSMVGVTLYSPNGEQRQKFPRQAREKASAFSGEKLISFEVIPHEQPKRSFKAHESY